MNEVDNSAVKDDGVSEPELGMEFASEDAAKSFYDYYARRVGFRTRVSPVGRFRPDTTVTSRVFVCARDGIKRKSADGCEAMLKVELKGERWVVTGFVKDHNHGLVSSSKVHYPRSSRHFAGAARTVDETNQLMGIVPSGAMHVSVDRNSTPAEAHGVVRSVSPVESNHQFKGSGSMNPPAVRPDIPKRTLGKDAQNMLDYFKKMQAENPGFFYAIQLDEHSRISNVFWADVRSRVAYSHFGDAITLDTTYRINQCKVPFAPFTGVNHHGQTILFGCALLMDDSEASFVWLFKTFLTAMSDRQPVSITTDQDRVIQTAVSQVFPRSRHRISKWHVLREGQERLAHFCAAHQNFQIELYKCINLTETVDEFESSWASVVDKYNLGRNDWLLSLYNTRQQWVPVYFRDSFFAAVSPNQGFDFSFFDSFVNQHTTLPMFFRQYERAMECWFEKEIEADFETMSTAPGLRTPSPMEKQAGDLYTRKIFTMFQEELVETFVYTANQIDGDGATRTYRVAKFEDDHKAYTVTLNVSDMRASCSCQMFEYSGILCRHILTVFTVTNVPTIPSHYILRRWTKDAKAGVALDESRAEEGLESTASRYNSLCREAVRFAQEGALAPETFHAALAALREGTKRVDVLKKNVAELLPDTPQATSVAFENKKTSATAGDMTPLLWPQTDEVLQGCNLNYYNLLPQAGADSKLPRMSPVSLQRDDGVFDSMVILPCLKSMTWAMESKSSSPENRVAVINLKLQDYSKRPAGESDVKFQLSRVTLEPMLRSMAYMSDQLSGPSNRVAVINLKLQDTEATSGDSEVKFQVSKDTLVAMLRSMAYIREQLSNAAESQTDPPSKRSRK